MKYFSRSYTFLVILVMALILGACTLARPSEEKEVAEPSVSTESELRVTLEAPASLPSGEAVTVKFTLTNSTAERLYVLKWYTPLEGLAGEIFRVERDGEAIPYGGMLAKRGAPLPDNYILIDPGTSVSAEVDLATAYDFSRAGDYTIEFLSPVVSHIAREETAKASTLEDLKSVQIPSNTVTVQIVDSAK